MVETGIEPGEVENSMVADTVELEDSADTREGNSYSDGEKSTAN